MPYPSTISGLRRAADRGSQGGSRESPSRVHVGPPAGAGAGCSPSGNGWATGARTLRPSSFDGIATEGRLAQPGAWNKTAALRTVFGRPVGDASAFTPSYTHE